MKKVKLARGYFFYDEVTGFSISYGEIKEIDEEKLNSLLERGYGNKLKIYVEGGENE